MDESGQLGKYFRNWFSSVNPSDCESHQIDSLGIDKVFTSFVFMLLGLTLASLIFLLEGSIQKKRFEKTKRTVLGGWSNEAAIVFKQLQSNIFLPIRFQRRRNTPADNESRD